MRTARLLWPDWLEGIWAKSPLPGHSKGEGLPLHTFRVLSRLLDTMGLRPGLGSQMGVPGLGRSLFWAGLLHDWGKAARGFQASLRGASGWGHRHEVLSLVFIEWLAGALSDQERQWVAAAIASHHRDLLDIVLLYPEMRDLEEDPVADPLSELDEMTLLSLRRWLVECLPSWLLHFQLRELQFDPSMLPDPAVAVDLVLRRGVEGVRRWLRAYRRLVADLERSGPGPLTVAATALRGHMVTSDHAASAHAVRLPPVGLGPGDIHEWLQLDPRSLYVHQRRSAQTQGSAILVAPTGSGKTEAALLWAHAQRSSATVLPPGESHLVGATVPRLFYLLPYQASMNAMYDRLEKAFPGRVGLEHSRSKLALYRAMLDREQPAQAAARIARVQSNLARLHHYPIRVMSPYQMLKAPYRLKGYEGLLTDFLGACCVLDEIHAYEPRRLALILATVEHLAEHYGARFFVMSATLAPLLIARIQQAVGECPLVRATPDLFARFRRHRLCLEEGDLLDDAGVALVERSARTGQSVLACCNTVRRARALYERLGERLGDAAPLILLHGLFNGRDRLCKEALVRRATGAKSTQRQPIVLISTQVVEVSLDIDLDMIYTDPAPLEALVQRCGRVNRRCLRPDAPAHVFWQPEDGQGVYSQALVKEALRLLEKNDGCVIDEAAVSEWLDGIYRGEIARSWQEEYSNSREQFVKGALARLRPFQSDEALEEQFYEAFDGIEVLPSALEAEYRQLESEDPLRASELLVPLAFREYARLRSQGRAVEARDRPPGWPRVIDAEYSSERGLVLKSA